MNKSLNYLQFFNFRTLFASLMIAFMSWAYLTAENLGSEELILGKLFGVINIVCFGIILFSVAKMIWSKRWIPVMASFEIDFGIICLVLGCVIVTFQTKTQWLVYGIGFMFIVIAAWWLIMGYKIIKKERTWQQWRIDHGIDDMLRITDVEKYSNFLVDEVERMQLTSPESVKQLTDERVEQLTDESIKILTEIRAKYVALHEKQEKPAE